jgi:hypothetical protein
VKRERDEGHGRDGQDQGPGSAGRRSAAKQPRRTPGRAAAAEQQQQQQQQQPRGRRRPAASAGASEEQEEEEEDAVMGDEDSGGEEPPTAGRSGKGRASTAKRQRTAASGAKAKGGRRRPAEEQDEAAEEEQEAAAGEDEEQEQPEEDDAADMDEEARIQRAMQLMQTLSAAQRGHVRDKGLAGHVKSVKLQNFMCHENFEMEFSSHVNFISGQNGSGKSAVLQALQICLGATARETGRGKNLRALIRSGRDEAVLRVTIWNTGADAYRHRTHALGDWVTIERKITASGAAADGTGVSSTWKVYDQHGRKVDGATRKNTIEPMLDRLNIAAENPLCVMTQVGGRCCWFFWRGGSRGEGHVWVWKSGG